MEKRKMCQKVRTKRKIEDFGRKRKVSEKEEGNVKDWGNRKKFKLIKRKK